MLRSAVDVDSCERVRESLDWWHTLHPEVGARVQDAWRTSSAVRELACHPGIMAAIESMYGRRAIPFQTLNFARATQQELHADSVHFDSVPSGWMCGAWVALEEVGPDQGPLMVVPSSQRVTPRVFSEVRGSEDTFDMGRYEQLLAHRLVDLGVEEFHASAGDALVWAADLAHGGAHLRNAQATRWSQVTHYFFEGCTYVTPVLGDARTGEMYLREPLVDIASGRSAVHSFEDRPARIIRTRRGLARLVPADAPRVPLCVRTTSAVRGLLRRTARRAGWSRRRLRAAVQRRRA